MRAVVDLARSLHLHVVAEGIETEAEANLLRTMGGTTGQGYLFAKPLPAHQLDARLAERAHLTRV